MKKIIIMLGIAMLLVTGGFFIFNDKLTGSVVADNTAASVKAFTIQAFRFGYSPDVINVNRGDKVKIIINNTDTLHGIRIPDLGIRGNEVLEFTANKTGEFTWYCTNMCGNGHMQMQGKLIVK